MRGGRRPAHQRRVPGERAEIVREKGTDRSRFLRGEVDKYTWQDVGSSYLMSEVSAALLVAQSEGFEAMQARRHEVWEPLRQRAGGVGRAAGSN